MPDPGTRIATTPCMQKTTTALETPLREQLDRLAAFEPSNSPVLSLYLDMRASNNGREHYESFLRKNLLDRGHALKDDALESFEKDAERIRTYLEAERRPATNGIAIFACTACDFFEAVQLDVPLEEHQLFIGAVPHLYPLARINDQYPRYAALLVNSNSAALFVFGLGTTEKTQRVTNEKTRRSSVGGWSQARYQRHTENVHLHHMKEVAEVLEKVIREERINQIVVACDDSTRPMLMEQLPKHLAEKIVDVIALDMKTPGQQVLAETLDALRQKDAETDAEQAEAMIGAWRGRGLGVAGPEETLKALEMGQVEELLITAKPDQLLTKDGADPQELAGILVAKAQQNSARIRFIEDPELLSGVGGVGALLRFKI